MNAGSICVAYPGLFELIFVWEFCAKRQVKPPGTKAESIAHSGFHFWSKAFSALRVQRPKHSDSVGIVNANAAPEFGGVVVAGILFKLYQPIEPMLQQCLPFIGFIHLAILADSIPKGN